MNLKVVCLITSVILGALSFNSFAQWHAPDLQEVSNQEFSGEEEESLDRVHRTIR